MTILVRDMPLTFPRLARLGLHLTPFLAGELASVLSSAIQRFELQGYRVRDIGRLPAAAARLRKVKGRLFRPIAFRYAFSMRTGDRPWAC